MRVEKAANKLSLPHNEIRSGVWSFNRVWTLRGNRTLRPRAAGFFLPGLAWSGWGHSLPRNLLFGWSEKPQCALRAVPIMCPLSQRRCLSSLWWQIWSFSYSFTWWKENCNFLVHDPHPLSFMICAREVIMSPDLPQVRLAWDSSYGRRQNIWTLRLVKCSAVLVKSQKASS